MVSVASYEWHNTVGEGGRGRYMRAWHAANVADADQRAKRECIFSLAMLRARGTDQEVEVLMKGRSGPRLCIGENGSALLYFLQRLPCLALDMRSAVVLSLI